ncbi:von Willebrand factor A domain-containing protein 5A-like isoform X1 [Stylophora pistillata]|uniref:von Willebrand factor A domain-containing protein 5A-like isoform X1 n=1 Tax=Stylophora pistillata TaxID=50429 RepID=UPI000C0434DF|nr:von Willebrand factor A domain-containing protein 5A-like isoform X1 [Stylophora pistillata]
MAGRFGLVQKQNGSKVPLESINIKVDVQGFTAHVLATMKYSNMESNPIEAIFVFPLDEQAAVCGFQATIDGRTIVAEVQEKQEARDTYDDAISSGHSAFLLEESDESSDIFQISVGNLPPEKEAVVDLRFVTELAVEAEGRVVFVLPTVLNPRYSPQDTTPSLSAQYPRVAAVSSPYGFEFEMKVKAISSISEISSSSNSLQVEINESDVTEANVTLAEAHKFDRDVEVHILTSEPFKPQAIVERGVKREGTEDEEGFMASPVVMLNFFPEFKTSELSEKGEFVFVVDRSGSMSGSKENSARETLLLFLKSLPDGCYFNVVGFGSSYKTLFSKSLLYNDENLKKATDLAGSMKADLRGTEILSPLQWVFSQPLVKGHPRQLFLLTDGEVGNTQQVISLVEKHSNSARCFTFGIGAGASTALVKGVARVGKGTAEFVTAKEDRLQAKVIKTLKRARQPVITDVSVNWKLDKGWTVHQIPASVPALFSGDRVVVYGVLKASENENYGSGVNEVRLEGNAENVDQVCHIIQFATPDVEDSWDNDAGTEGKVLLHRLAAKNSIQEKQDDVIESSDSGPRTEKAKSYVISISKTANVVSKLTSFVAVDKDSREPVSGPLQKRVPYLASMSFFGGGGMKSASRFKCKSQGFFFNTAQCANVSGGGNAFAAPPPPPPGVMSANVWGGGSALVAPVEAAVHPSGSVWGGGSAFGVPPPPSGPMSTSSKGFFSSLFGSAHKKKGSFSAPPVSAHNKKEKVVHSSLSVISLQKASGSWDLTDQLVSLCDASRDDLIKICPKEIAADTAEGELLWATALALILLMGKYADQKDEWEMIAEKGTKWLKKNLPGSLTLDQVLESAATVVGVRLKTGL